MKRNFKKVLINKIYIYIISLKKMFKARNRNNVYVIKKIVKNLNKFVLFLAMRYNFASSINIDINFLNRNNIVKFALINSINVNTDLVNVNSSLTNVVN